MIASRNLGTAPDSFLVNKILEVAIDTLYPLNYHIVHMV